MVVRVLIVSGVLFCCGAYVHHRRRTRERAEAQAQEDARRRAQELQEAIAGVWSEPRALIADVETNLRGPGQSAAVVPATGRKLEVALTPQAQRNAWSAAQYLALEGQTENREQALRQILQSAVAPQVDWSQGWSLYQGDNRFRDVYEATGDLLTLAELSNKYAPGTNPTSSGALVCPGWVHERPAPSADLRPNDYVEVLLAPYSPDPGEELRSAEWAWIRVESVPRNGEGVAGTVTLETPPGAASNVLQHSSVHGFEPGTSIIVPRRCIFRVIKGR